MSTPPEHVSSARTERQRIDDFWRWWSSEGAAAVTSALDAKDAEAVLRLTTDRVDALEPRLAWEYGAGNSSRYALSVTAGGDPAVRGIARRWLRSAPAPDATWEFHDLRQPTRSRFTLDFGDQRLDSGDVVVTASPRGAVLDVQVAHPVLASIPPEAAANVAYLLLDNTIGEEAVELWLGTIDAVGSLQSPGLRLDELPAAVASVRDEHTDDDGALSWVLLRSDEPGVVRTRIRLSPVTEPDFDTHVAVRVPYPAREDGFPQASESDSLAAFEDHVVARLEGSGTVVAVETARGRRTIHLYVDGTTPAVDMVRAAVAGWPHGRVEVTSRTDPGWESVRAFEV